MGLLHEAEFWFTIAVLIFVAIIWRPAKRFLIGGLDARAERIREELAAASDLRQEAERTLTQAAAEGGAILQHAREEAERMQAKAAASLQAAVALREQQALDRIAQSETAATKQVRDTAVDVALAATRALLREQVGAGRSEAMVNEAIGELPRRLH